jgi:hypothetical protein
MTFVGASAFAQDWLTNGATLYHLGKVGIGTNASDYGLTVSGDLGFFGAGLDGSSLQRATIYANTSNHFLIEAPKTSAGDKLNISFNWRGSGPTPFFIQGSNANVGINTTSPYQKLTVNGVLGIYGSGLDGSILQHTSIYTDVANGLLIEGAKTSSGTKLDISFNWRGSGIVPFIIKGSNSNVGLGTSNPDEKLTVKGKIHAEEVRVDLSVPGPDYVFDKDYSLLPLRDLEAYISSNKHLPEVPSAKQMAENGLELKEMNLLLLKKVEELTLHLIEANKKIEKLSDDVKALKEK